LKGSKRSHCRPAGIVEDALMAAFGISRATHRLREAAAFRARNVQARGRDAIDVMTGRRDPLTPPRRMLTGDYSEFERLGDEFRDLFVKLGGLKPPHAVLDIGCGPGRMAVPLTGWLEGPYEGFDIVSEEVAWCRDTITPRHPNFRFQRPDVQNDRYNPTGTIPAGQFRFPYPDGTFDFAFATSVFTHMLPEHVDRYLGEIGRVLRPGGRALITWFLLTDESQERIAAGTTRFTFAIPSGVARIDDPASPEAAVAYPESWVAGRSADHGLTVASRHPGGWCGTPDPPTWQDVVVLEVR
jgi:SAM-dependent methyltransferase